MKNFNSGSAFHAGSSQWKAIERIMLQAQQRRTKQDINSRHSAGK